MFVTVMWLDIVLVHFLSCTYKVHNLCTPCIKVEEDFCMDGH